MVLGRAAESESRPESESSVLPGIGVGAGADKICHLRLVGVAGYQLSTDNEFLPNGYASSRKH